MYKTIVLDCQGKNSSLNCEDCIVFKECNLNKKRNEEHADPVKNEDMEIFVSHVWKFSTNLAVATGWIIIN